MNITRFYRKHTFHGRLLAFVAWLALIALLLLGGAVGAAADSELAGILLCIPSVIVYCLLQMFAAKVEERYEAKTQNAKEANVCDDSPEQKAQNKQSGGKNMLSGNEELVQKSMKCLCELLPEKMPASGKCAPLAIQFHLPGTNHVAYIEVACDAADPQLRRVITRIVRSGTDVCMMNYMKHGTMDEILDYLADSAHVAPLLNSLQHLSDRIDEEF